jgi:hypothetical protein
MSQPLACCFVRWPCSDLCKSTVLFSNTASQLQLYAVANSHLSTTTCSVDVRGVRREGAPEQPPPEPKGPAAQRPLPAEICRWGDSLVASSEWQVVIDASRPGLPGITPHSARGILFRRAAMRQVATERRWAQGGLRPAQPARSSMICLLTCDSNTAPSARPHVQATGHLMAARTCTPPGPTWCQTTCWSMR